MLRPDALQALFLSLGMPDDQWPARDAFAQPHNALFRDFWSPEDDGLAQDWLGLRPVWANPPFSLLPRVVAKLRQEGGKAIVLSPEWSPAMLDLHNLARKSVRLPDQPLYLLRGAKLLPAPTWRTWAFWCDIPRPSPLDQHLAHAGAQAVDIRPGDRLPPVQETAPVFDHRTPFILERDLPPLALWERRHCPGATVILVPLHGRLFAKMGSELWDIRFPHPQQCPRCPVWHWPWDCPSLLPVHGPLPCPPKHSASPAFLITPTYPLQEQLHLNFQPCSQMAAQQVRPGGRLPSESHGQVRNAIPPPQTTRHPETTQNPPASGRGMDLLTCGDVEANPGPIPGGEDPGMALDVDAMVTQLCASNQSLAPPPPALVQVPVPFSVVGCPAMVPGTHLGDALSAFPPGVRAPPPPLALQGPQSSALPMEGAPCTSLDLPDPGLQPSWDEIAMDARGTIIHIPRGALQAVTTTYVSLLKQFLRENSWESFHALWAFCVRVPDRV